MQVTFKAQAILSALVAPYANARSHPHAPSPALTPAPPNATHPCSAGVAITVDGRPEIIKACGKIDALEAHASQVFERKEYDEHAELWEHAGIAHTRWASECAHRGGGRPWQQQGTSAACIHHMHSCAGACTHQQPVQA